MTLPLREMPGNLLLKKVAIKVPITAQETPRKYARIVSMGTLSLSSGSATALTPGYGELYRIMTASILRSRS